MLRILGRASSSAVQKVTWTLSELGLPYDRVDVGGEFGGNWEESYLRLNPNGLVPTLVDGDTVVWESNTICRYVCNLRYGTSLYPLDPNARSQVERWMDWQLSALHMGFMPLYAAIARTPPELRLPNVIDELRKRAEHLFAILDRFLKGRSFMVGDALTLADIVLGPSIHRWCELALAPERFPAVNRWYDHMCERKSFLELIVGA